ncbi:MAG: carboxymuconolactone decarboxylase family protein [Acidimicrobiia bacterium]
MTSIPVVGVVAAASPLVAIMTPATAPLLTRNAFADGQPDPITAVLAQVPELFDVAMPFIGATLGPSFVPHRVKEIVILRTSSLLECEYCVGAHTVAAVDAGLLHDELRSLRAELSWADVFADPAERALIAWIDAIARGRGPVDATTANAMTSHWEDAAVVEITVLIGTTMMLNRLCTGLALPLGAETRKRLAAEGFGA